MGSLLSFLVNPGERKCVFPQTADEVAPSEAGRRGGLVVLEVIGAKDLRKKRQKWLMRCSY